MGFVGDAMHVDPFKDSDMREKVERERNVRSRIRRDWFVGRSGSIGRREEEHRNWVQTWSKTEGSNFS